MSTFKDINDHLVYIKTKTKTEALKLRDDAKKTVLDGKCVVIFFNDRYHSYLASGFDPYQIRKEIENFLNPPPVETPKTKSTKKNASKNTITRSASGRFVSKKETTSASPPTKKSFWNSILETS